MKKNNNPSQKQKNALQGYNFITQISSKPKANPTPNWLIMCHFIPLKWYL
jgi:hypothetical protein